MKDLLKQQLRAEYFKANIKKWKSELEKYKENKESLVEEYTNSDDIRFKTIPQNQKEDFIREFIEDDIRQYESKIKKIEKEIENSKLEK